MIVWRPWISRKPSMNSRPRRRAFAGRSSRSMNWIAALAAAHETAFPPKVVRWDSGGSLKVAITSGRLMKPPSGRPPPIALAMQITSGTTFHRSQANHSPVRAKPVWTSSRIINAPTSSQILRSPGR